MGGHLDPSHNRAYWGFLLISPKYCSLNKLYQWKKQFHKTRKRNHRLEDETGLHRPQRGSDFYTWGTTTKIPRLWWSNQKPNPIKVPGCNCQENEERQLSFNIPTLQHSECLWKNINSDRSVTVHLDSFPNYTLRRKIIRGSGYLVCFPKTLFKNTWLLYSVFYEFSFYSFQSILIAI